MESGHNFTLFTLTLDPANPNLTPMLENGTLVRHILHEVPHYLRMRGPGYGWTLMKRWPVSLPAGCLTPQHSLGASHYAERIAG